jgi:hypothetical protein
MATEVHPSASFYFSMCFLQMPRTDNKESGNKTTESPSIPAAKASAAATPHARQTTTNNAVPSPSEYTNTQTLHP